MGFKRGDHLRAIIDGLAHVERICELRGILKLLDDHVLAQNFFCRVLNAVYGLKLVELDKLEANYPAIDLGDSENRIAFQVTAERRGEKIQDMLDKFVEHKLEADFDQLRVLVIGKRQTSYKSVAVPTQVQFDPETHILGTSELVRDIEKLTTPRLESLAAIFGEELHQKRQGPGRSERQTIEEYLERYHRLVEKNRGYILGQIMQLQRLSNFAAWERAKLDGTLKQLAMLCSARNSLMAGPETAELLGAIALMVPILKDQFDTPTEDDAKQQVAFLRWSELTRKLGVQGPTNDADVQAWQHSALRFLDTCLTATAAKERLVREAAKKWITEREERKSE